MQSLQAEVEPFGIHTITANPGFFRTELLTKESTNFAERTIEDYNERRAQQMQFWKFRPFLERLLSLCMTFLHIGLSHNLRKK